MSIKKRKYGLLLSAAALVVGLGAGLAAAADAQSLDTSGKLLLTGGVSQIEGAAGGGLTPWAVIGGYETDGQIGGNVFYTDVGTQDYNIKSYGALVGIHNRVEFSYARQDFDTRNVGAALGLGYGYTISQDTFGVKVRVLGDAILQQDSWLPQISVGAQFKSNKNGALVKALGARDDHGTDYYVSATKLFLAQSLLVNATVRETKANQFGILGYGGIDDHYHTEVEGSVAYLLTRQIAIGAEFRAKPDNLAVAHEGNAYDAFVAYAPTKNLSFTLAYADLGNIVTRKQHGLYLSLQAGF
ncbi:DUF3034 family protein [Asticcacaulis sp. EMRT-3]|uniref:DUF3034 family protein n=1 Tax=Asticcacaulis sp. EMRT-3 TaxID=3040349 RepID=UPI0024AEEFD8|nr:DUF3034 family protein [Asticcacaulis sp. EMRT-3]MDI7775604.1 DUF3034 family protein [Asticcacaulis sp. EMRT-3]